MKKILLAVLFAAVSLATATAGAYDDAMTKALEQMKTGKSAADLVASAGQFERIGKVAGQEWLPRYYAGYCFVLASFMEKDDDKRDGYADEAEKWVNEGLKLAPKEAELVTLLGYVYQAKLSISPMTRGMKYSSLVQETLEKAIELNPQNPRPYHLLGQNLLFTPAMFGGGTEKACPLLKQADAKFAKFEKSTPLHPGWGKTRNDQLMEKCK